MHRLRSDLFAHLQRQSLDFFTRTRGGEVQSRLVNDIGSMQGVVTQTATSIAANVTVVVGTAVAMVALSWRLALISLVVLPPAVLLTRQVARMRHRDHRRAAAPPRRPPRPDRGGPLGQRRAAHQDPRRVPAPDRAVRRDLRRPRRPRDPLPPRRPLADGDDERRLRRRPGRDLPRRRLPGDVRRDDHRHARRLHRPAGHPVPPADGPAQRRASTSPRRWRSSAGSSSTPTSRSTSPSPTSRSGSTARRVRGEVRFEGVGFVVRRRPAGALRHRPRRPGGRHARPGRRDRQRQVDARLARPAPARRDVRAGAASTGSTCATWPRPTSPRVVGVVTQETYLMHASVRDNLRHARPDATDAEIEQACRTARIHDVIASLPEGYDTVVGSRGHRFSGGEQQRLAIARTLLRDPAVLVLDEATSALDNETERAILATLDDGHPEPYDDHDRAPALHRAQRRPDRRAPRRARRRARHPRGAAAPRRPLRRPRARRPRRGAARPPEASGRRLRPRAFSAAASSTQVATASIASVTSARGGIVGREPDVGVVRVLLVGERRARRASARCRPPWRGPRRGWRCPGTTSRLTK